MRRLLRVMRAILLVAGLAGMALSAWAFLDPAAFPAAHEGFGGTSPRWRAAFGFVFSGMIAAWGAGLLRHRELP